MEGFNNVACVLLGTNQLRQARLQDRVAKIWYTTSLQQGGVESTLDYVLVGLGVTKDGSPARGSSPSFEGLLPFLLCFVLFLLLFFF